MSLASYRTAPPRVNSSSALVAPTVPQPTLILPQHRALSRRGPGISPPDHPTTEAKSRRLFRLGRLGGRRRLACGRRGRRRRNCRRREWHAADRDRGHARADLLGIAGVHCPKPTLAPPNDRRAAGLKVLVDQCRQLLIELSERFAEPLILGQQRPHGDRIGGLKRRELRRWLRHPHKLLLEAPPDRRADRSTKRAKGAVMCPQPTALPRQTAAPTGSVPEAVSCATPPAAAAWPARRRGDRRSRRSSASCRPTRSTRRRPCTIRPPRSLSAEAAESAPAGRGRRGSGQLGRPSPGRALRPRSLPIDRRTAAARSENRRSVDRGGAGPPNSARPPFASARNRGPGRQDRSSAGPIPGSGRIVCPCRAGRVAARRPRRETAAGRRPNGR